MITPKERAVAAVGLLEPITHKEEIENLLNGLNQCMITQKISLSHRRNRQLNAWRMAKDNIKKWVKP